MSYYLLWVETLLACLLFAATLITVGLRRKVSIVSIPLCAAGLLPPLLPIGYVVAAFAAMRFGAGLQNSGFWWAVALVVCYLTGAIGTLLVGRRRDAVGMRQAFSWPLARIATAWLVAVSLIAMTVWNLDLRAQMEIQALRTEAGAIALSVSPPQVPDAVNAAWVYEQADKQFEAAQSAADQRIDYLDYRDLDNQSPEVRDYLNRQQKAMATIRRAADMPQCRLDYDYGSPDLNVIRPQLNLLHAHAILLAVAANAEAANGTPDAALADCLRIYAIGQHANSAPLLTGELTTMAIDALASKTVARVLPNVTAKEQMDHFPIPEPNVLSRAFVRSLRSEEAFGLARFCDVGSGQNLFFDFFGKSYPGNGALPFGTCVWLLWLRDDVNIYREYLSRERHMAQKVYYQSAAELKKIEDEPHHGVISTLTAPSVLGAARALANTQALRASVAVACAATRYRLDHGQYPATSDLLVPGYLAAVPVDPFDGQAMRMKKRPDGSLVIYSVGADGKDDGGVVDSPDSKTPPSDVGITLKMPAGR